ncbi:TetR/AcrR family transcriptional regulator [Mycolicibacterium moriokaense]|uniref:TetR family transcriptional regulator n=1 Tax=Mycolicibacterium moriokaense TaxID=39691 RepID=A0A318H8T1_9MYCO|nr:TetR/AcrR family transcriptional regulator C-terminal domain-containing protein [Mycolicibacterium moriokaense]PXX01644.1 TetR family transcriptional regulator [Mycolicibacterium moriokaense]
MPGKASRPKGAGRERTLSQERIIEGALKLISRHGAATLTMRQLAAALGVSPMAAYYHVESKDDLIRLVGDAVLSEVAVPRPAAGTWDVRLEELITKQREALIRYPGLREALSGLDLAQRRRLEDAEYDLLVEAGFAPDQVVPAFRVLLDWTLGNSRVESSLRDPASRRPPHDWTKAQRATFDRNQMPALTADDYFQFGLKAVIAGLRAAKDAAGGGADSSPKPARAAKNRAKPANAVKNGRSVRGNKALSRG